MHLNPTILNSRRKLRVYCKKIQDWILKSERIRKWIAHFFTKQIKLSKVPQIVVCQRNQWFNSGQGFFDSFDAP